MEKWKTISFVLLIILLSTSCSGMEKKDIPTEIEINENEILHQIVIYRPKAAKHLNNGDFYLRYEHGTTTDENNGEFEKIIAHFIPVENNRFKIEDRLHSAGYSYISPDVGLPIWEDILYPKDTTYADKRLCRRTTNIHLTVGVLYNVQERYTGIEK